MFLSLSSKASKKPLFFLLVVGIFFYSTFIFSQETPEQWRPEKLIDLETQFEEFSTQIDTLEEFAPEKLLNFKELEIINQLVEQLDFNKRKFDLLIKQYNLIEDQLFPYIIELASQNPHLTANLFNLLKEYTDTRKEAIKSILHLQQGINQVALSIERLEVRIERLQVAAREKEVAEEKSKKNEETKQTASIHTKLNQLRDEKNDFETKIEEEKEKFTQLQTDEKEKEKKIEEKRNEITDLEKQARQAKDRIERLIYQTNARVRGIRLNGLEIPRLNTIKTFIYLSKTSLETNQKKVENIDKDIRSLEDQQRQEIINKLFRGVLVIAIAFFMVFILLGISRRLSKKFLNKIDESNKIDPHRKQRYQTLSQVILSFIKVAFWIMAALWVLGELEIDYAPFLVAAGGISLAIGFGAQSLVKDVVSGFFILMEEQFALGDVVEISGDTGTVEKISLRTIKFRSLDGTLHIIPNGSISKVSNQTYQWSRALVNVGVSYDDDPKKVLAVLQQVCQDIFQDPEWQKKLEEEPIPQGILSFGDSSVNFRVMAKTKPGLQWEVGRELHIRIKIAFDQNSIEIPYNYINVIDRTTKPVTLTDGSKEAPQ